MGTIRARRQVTDQYVEADKYFIVNDNDPDLEAIKIWLPKPPALSSIANYGLRAEDQKFQVSVMPKRLSQIKDSVKTKLQLEFVKNKRKTITGQKLLQGVLEVLNEKRKDYEDEISWIYDQIYFITKGYWVFINGKPTFLDPWFYEYLNFFNLDIGLPDYRDRDRRWFLFARHCYTTTTDGNGHDLGFRTCYGFTYPKHRRDGATYKCLCIGQNIVRYKKRALFGIQSFNDNNAGEHFKEKLVPAWRNSPFFLKPMWAGSNDPAEELNFSLPANLAVGYSNESKINYATTAHRSFYDGKKQMVHQSEENGKTLREDILLRHEVVKQTLSQGNGAIIHGFSMHPTTVADMEAGGGYNFHTLCDQSAYYDRSEVTGQTKSGLFRLFIPAYDGLEGFIGPYGESIINTPTPEQAKFINRKNGAKEHLESELVRLRLDDTPESQKKIKELIQLFPTTYADCFRMAGGDVGFDVEILDYSIAQSKRANPKPTVTGDFMYSIDGQLLSAKDFIDKKLDLRNMHPKVLFIPNPNGHFEVSKQLPSNMTNRKYSKEYVSYDGFRKQSYYPVDGSNMFASADPFQFLDPNLIKFKKNKDTMSDGGGAVFWKRDENLDPDSKPIDNWDSQRFVCTYMFRTSLDDYYAEEMLMMSIYYNAYMFPERNIKIILKHFIRRGYGGYLMNKVNPMTGKVDTVPGFHSLTESKDDLFKATRNHIRLHGRREVHFKLLDQWRRIKNIKEMTSYDLLTAAGGCLLAAENPYEILVSSPDRNSISIKDVYRAYKRF